MFVNDRARRHSRAASRSRAAKNSACSFAKSWWTLRPIILLWRHAEQQARRAVDQYVGLFLDILHAQDRRHVFDDSVEERPRAAEFGVDGFALDHLPVVLMRNNKSHQRKRPGTALRRDPCSAQAGSS